MVYLFPSTGSTNWKAKKDCGLLMNKQQIHTQYALDNMDRFGGLNPLLLNTLYHNASLAFCYSQADPDNQTSIKKAEQKI